MIAIVAYVCVGGFGLLIAHLVSRAPELRLMRLSQLILVPAALVIAATLLPKPGESMAMQMGNFIVYAAIFGLLAILLAPNIAYYCGLAFTNLLDPMDWTPLEEEIALRPIKKLIDRDLYQEALTELDGLLEKHKPTYEALLLKSRLLYHVGSVQETEAVLLSMIALSHTTHQQMAVMAGLAALADRQEGVGGQLIGGTRQARIEHELMLFPMGSKDLSEHKEIPPGEYKVEEVLNGRQLWFKLAGEDWGNAAICWEAIQKTKEAETKRQFQNVFSPIARMHEAVTKLLTGTPRHHAQMQARVLLKEANQYIRQEQWEQALPILENAVRRDPEYYEAAYRLVQAARRSRNQAASAQILREVLRQSKWSEDEKFMLEKGTDEWVVQAGCGRGEF